MTITPTGIAVTLAIVVALGMLFFGPAAMNFFSSPSDLPANAFSGATGGDAVPPTPSDTLGVTDEAVGTGRAAAAGDQITVQYVGMLTDGTVFDSSAGRGPFVFTLGTGAVIQGWDQGLIGMKEGGKRTLVIPPSMAYGSQDLGVIPPNSTLIFQVELVKVGQ